MRFPRKPDQRYRIYGYFFVLLISGFFILSGFVFFSIYNYSLSYTWLLMIVCGLICNFRLLYVSWLRVECPNKLVRFLNFEGISNLVGCLFLFAIDQKEMLLTLVIAVRLLPFLAFALIDLPEISELKHGFTNIKFKHLKALLTNCFIFSLSLLFIIHQSTIIRAIYLQTLPPEGFVALSVALSISSNTQKLALTYFWVIQKNIFSSLMTKTFVKKQILIIPISIFLVLTAIYSILFFISKINQDLNFDFTILIICFFLTMHRICSASFRGLLLRLLGIRHLLRKQILAVIIILPLGIYFYLGAFDFTLLLGIFLLTEFLIVYIYPFKNIWSKLPTK